MSKKKQTLDLLKPENDSLTLGHTFSTFTELSNKVSSSVSSIPVIQSTVNSLSNKVSNINATATSAKQDANTALESYQEIDSQLSTVSGDLEAVAQVVTENARNISTNATNIATNAENIAKNAEDIEAINTTLGEHTTSITSILERLSVLPCFFVYLILSKSSLNTKKYFSYLPHHLQTCCKPDVYEPLHRFQDIHRK